MKVNTKKPIKTAFREPFDLSLAAAALSGETKRRQSGAISFISEFKRQPATPTMATTTQSAARQTTLAEGACVQGCRHLKRHGVLGSSGHVRLLTELT